MLRINLLPGFFGLFQPMLWVHTSVVSVEQPTGLDEMTRPGELLGNGTKDAVGCRRFKRVTLGVEYV